MGYFIGDSLPIGGNNRSAAKNYHRQPEQKFLRKIYQNFTSIRYFPNHFPKELMKCPVFYGDFLIVRFHKIKELES